MIQWPKPLLEREKKKKGICVILVCFWFITYIYFSLLPSKYQLSTKKFKWWVTVLLGLSSISTKLLIFSVFIIYLLFEEYYYFDWLILLQNLRQTLDDLTCSGYSVVSRTSLIYKAFELFICLSIHCNDSNIHDFML